MRFSLRRMGAVILKELRHITRDVRIFFLVTVSPAFLLLVLAYIFAFDVGEISLGWMDGDRTATSRALLAAVTADGTFRLTEAIDSYDGIEAGLLAGRLDAVLVVKPGFEAELLRGDRRPVSVQAVVDGTDSIAAAQALGNLSARVTAFGARQAGAASAIDIRTRAWYNPDLKSLLSMVPGLLAIVMTLPALALTLAVTREKEVGTLEALIASPVRPAEYLLGKLAAYVLSGLVSAGLAVAVALLWFGVPFRGSFALFMALAAVYYLAAMGVSLVIAQVVGSQQTAMLLVLFVFFVPSFFVAGLIQPVDTTSRAAVITSYVLPSTHFIAIARSVFLKGAGLLQLQGHVAALILIGAASIALSLLMFRKRIG